MPVIGFVDLDRRFRDRTDAELEHSELEDTETFASLDGLGLGSSIGWTALLEHPGRPSVIRSWRNAASRRVWKGETPNRFRGLHG